MDDAAGGLSPPLYPRRVERLLAALVLVSAAYFYDLHSGPNAYAHLDQTHSIVAEGHLFIDPFLAGNQAAMTVGATRDWARASSGHYYPAKAPGLSFLAVPVYAFLFHTERLLLGVDPLAPDAWRVNMYAATLAVNGGLAAVGIVCVLRTLLLLRLSLAVATAATLGVTAGTGYVPYASMFYSHTSAAALVALAAWLSVAGVRAPTSAAGRRQALLAGAALGAATLVDYPAALAVPVLALYWAGFRGPRALAAFTIGGLPFLGVWLGYHWMCFGHPLATAYAFQNPAFNDPATNSYLQPFSLARLADVLVDPYRGLLVYSPVLVLVVPGAIRSWRRGLHRAECLAGLALLGLVLGLTTVWWSWWGGATNGPRFSILAMPMVAVVVALGLESTPRLGLLVLVLSIANQAGVLASGLLPDEGIRAPLFQWVYPMLLGAVGEPRPNLGSLLGLTGRASLTPVVGAWLVLGLLLDQATHATNGAER